jgi:hypothetical protein
LWSIYESISPGTQKRSLELLEAHLLDFYNRAVTLRGDSLLRDTPQGDSLHAVYLFFNNFTL